MPRYRIRYQGSDLEMPPGEFVVGRSSACHLALDDALVSRRHAAIHVQPDGVFVDDLGSRNGVLVNGERIPGRRKIVHLDRVTIGSHELVLVEIPDRPLLEAACETCGASVTMDMAFCQKCGHLLHKGSPTLAGMTLEIPAVRPDSMQTAKHDALRLDGVRVDGARPPSASGVGSEESTGRALLAGIADKALALGRFDEAERVLGKSLHEILARAKTGSVPPPSRIAEATKYALRLAEGTKRTAWLDWVFELHEAAGRLLGADDIERVHELVRKLRYTGAGPVRRYVVAMRARAEGFSASERFLLSRLEGIERMVSA
ncbi:FHA domain-containing protein [Sandaracinus amylolyticus]|nr:FHA domain-containing protein [Sandaracinus amylolyticus]